MIPKSAIEAYLSRELDSHLWVKTLTNKQLDQAISSLSPKPDLNSKLRLHQKACFLLGVANPKFCFWLDMGCVSGDTLVEVAEGPVRIDELVRRNEPISVWSNTSKGLRLVSAPAPFCKGETALYEVKFVSGNQITVAANHMFLTERGWTSCAALAIGERLPKFDVFRSQSTLEPSLLTFPLNASHLLGKPQDFQQCFRNLPCGEQPLLGEDTSQAFFPSPNETRERTLLLSQRDALGKGRTSTACYVFSHQSKKDYSLSKGVCCGIPVGDSSRAPNALSADAVYPTPPPTFLKSALLSAPYLQDFSNAQGLEEDRVLVDQEESGVSTAAYEGECTCGSWAHNNQEFFPSLEEFFVEQQVLSAFQGPSQYPIPFETITHICPKGKQRYYDMHVPEFHNYIAHGLCHHNTGKTILALELLRYWFKCGKVRRALIFVFSDKAFPTWERQLAEFNINLPLVLLTGSSEQKWKQLSSLKEGLALVAYPGAVYMATTRVKGNGEKSKLKLDLAKVKRLQDWTQAFVMDESTRASGDSLTFSLISQLRKTATVRYALAGRPFGRDPLMLWAQHYLIDDGETLGETKGLFRAAFYTEKQNYWDPRGYAKDYSFKNSMQAALSVMVQHKSITYSAAECIELPKVVPVVETVSFPEEAGTYYRRVIEQAIASKGDIKEMANVFLRMRQISSGFVGVTDDATGDRTEIEFEQNPKLERLLELIDEVPEGRGSVVFYEFTRSGRLIVKRLKELGCTPAWLWSGTKDTKKELEVFAKAKRPIIVINNKVGAMSIDGLQKTASYDFEFEAPVSVIDWEQARRRLVRDGQKYTVFQYSLQVKGTVDEKIRAYHAEGEDLFKALLRDPAKVFY